VTANTPEALAIFPEALALSEDIEIIDIANAEIEQPTRMESRRNKKGQLRGISWRERNKERKAVWYVGAKSKGQRKAQYDELKRTFANASPALAGRNEPPASVGSPLDRYSAVGNEQASRYLQ
jgi:hypothetical protein